MKTKFFNFKNINLDKKFKKNIINTFDFKEIFNYVYFCFKNKIRCIISDESLILKENTNDITLIKDCKIIKISWKDFFYYNNFIAKKYKSINKNYYSNNSIFNIFFLKFIDRTLHLNKHDSDVNLVNKEQSLFGIYNTYLENKIESKNNLYFSFNLNKFILYRVFNKDTHVVGKLLPNINYKDNKIIINKVEINCPKSFIKIEKNIFGIKKKNLTIIVKNKNIIKCNDLLQSYIDFCILSQNKNIYKILINQNLNNNYFRKLYEFLIKSYPNLENKSNLLLYLPSKIPDFNTHFSLYYQKISQNFYLIIEINQCIIQYLPYIINKIQIFLDTIKKTNVIYTEKAIIKNIKRNRHIHLISEIYFFISNVLLFLPKIFQNIKLNDNNYTQVNYKFSKKETNNLFKNKSSFFHSNTQFLKSIIIKALGVFLKNYYCFIHEENNIDILPLNSNTTNEEIHKILETSYKATCSKIFLISLISNFFNKLNNKKVEIPIIFININTIKNQNISIEKIYSKSKKKNIPIFINILHSEQLHISISYKNNYKKIKYIFNEIIEELI